MVNTEPTCYVLNIQVNLCSTCCVEKLFLKLCCIELFCALCYCVQFIYVLVVFSVQAIEMLSAAQSSVPIIFLVTDGTVEDERQICTMVKNHMINGDSICPRIYTFGIGMSSSALNLDTL